MTTEALPKHVPMDQFEIAEGCLKIGGITLTKLAEQVGRTPFYAYDRGLIAKRIGELREQLPDGLHLSYALKANPMPAAVGLIATLVDGFDVASAGELEVAIDSGVTPRRISFAGPGKTDEELARAIESGVVINMESDGEMERIAVIAGSRGARPRVAIRVNPDFELRSSGMSMGGGAKPFGIDAERVPQTLSRLSGLELDFEGFHIFWGSQNLNAEAVSEAQEKTVELALRLAEYAPAPVRLLNLGGGFGIPYFPGQQRLDLAAVGERMAGLLRRVGTHLPSARVVLELGRYIVGEAGIYVSRIVDRKESRGQVFLVTDGGLHHQLAASGNFGQVIRRNYPVAIGNKMDHEVCESTSVVGCLCTPLDLLADRIGLPRGEVGDLVVVFQSGAYGLTASPTAFLSHPAPLEVLV